MTEKRLLAHRKGFKRGLQEEFSTYVGYSITRHVIDGNLSEIYYQGTQRELLHENEEIENNGKMAGMIALGVLKHFA